MNKVKHRHNITVSVDTWELLELLRRRQGKSISHIIEQAVQGFAKEKGLNSTYFKIMANVLPCDDIENKELARLLDTLTDEDLEIVEKYEI